MTLRTFAASMICGALLPLSASAQTDVQFQMSWIASGEYAPLSAGIEKGFFRDVGINLTMTTGRGSGDAIAKVGAGVAPFGDADISAVMTARVRTATPVKCLHALQTKSPHSLFVLESSGIKGFKDLAGKKLGTTAGNSHFLYFPRVAKLSGIDPNSVSWVTVDASALAPMLIAKNIDAAPLFALNWYYQNKAAEKQGQRIKVIPFSESGFKIYAYCLTGNEKFVAANQDLTRRFLAAVQKSYLWARENMQEAAVLHVKRFPEGQVDDVVGTLKMQQAFMFNENTERDGFGFYNRNQLQETYAVVAEAQKLRPDFDVTEFVDTSYLRPR